MTEDLTYNAVTKSVQRMAKRTSPTERWLDILVNDPCSYCGSRKHMTLDHIHPIKLGAKRKLQVLNAAAACRRCNTSKGHTPLLRFLATRAGR